MTDDAAPFDHGRSRMAIRYTVRDGDCLSSIAFEHGFFPDTIWDDPANAALRELRDNPNALVAGDVLAIPDKQMRVEDVQTDRSHKFCLAGVPAKFRVQLRSDGEPIAGEPYVLRVDAITHRGTTPADGVIEVSIAPNARRAHLVVGDPEDDPREYDFVLGGLDPVDTLSGAQQRLANLGLLGDAGLAELGDELGPLTRAALLAFQLAYGLSADGELGPETQAKLAELHDHD